MKKYLNKKAIRLLYEAKERLDGGPGSFQAIADEIGDFLQEVLLAGYGYELKEPIQPQEEVEK